MGWLNVKIVTLIKMKQIKKYPRFLLSSGGYSYRMDREKDGRFKMLSKSTLISWYVREQDEDNWLELESSPKNREIPPEEAVLMEEFDGLI